MQQINHGSSFTEFAKKLAYHQHNGWGKSLSKMWYAADNQGSGFTEFAKKLAYHQHNGCGKMWYETPSPRTQK